MNQFDSSCQTSGLCLHRSFNILLLKPKIPLVYIIRVGTSPHFVTEITYFSQVLHRLKDAQLVEIFDAQVDDKVTVFFLAVLHFSRYLMLLSTFSQFILSVPGTSCQD